MVSLYISLGLHAAAWAMLALFAVRLTGWHQRGYRLLLCGLSLDLLAMSVWHFPEGARHLGLPVWNSMLDPIGLAPGSDGLTLIAFAVGSLLECGALVVCVWAFFDACRAAEELRYLQRPATDREIPESIAGQRDRGFDNAKRNSR